MDYLDPIKKRKHKQRILVGYFLFTIAIAMATTLLVFIAKGYYVDKSTGEFIQNGLIFIDSKPSGAKVSINGEKQRGTTDVRLVIPEGDYKIDLNLDGYRSWSRLIDLEGGSLRKLTYARLIPNKLESSAVLDLPYEPCQVSQSINKRWLVVADENTPLQMSIIDLEQTVPTITPLVLPESLFTPVAGGVLKFIDWTNDDKNLFASYDVGGVVTYLMINREDPLQSLNVSRGFGDLPLKISMVDRKADEFFVFNNSTQLLSKANLSSGISASPYIDRKLLGYQTFGTDWLLYVVESGKDGLVEARFRRGNDDIRLRLMKTDESYLLELAKQGNYPVMAVASPVEGFAVAYSDPQNYLKQNQEASQPVPSAVLRTEGIEDLTISSDSSVVMAVGPVNLASYEFEADRTSKITLLDVRDPGQELKWLDGQHVTYSSNGIQTIIDFDGSNQYPLVSSIAKIGSYYNSKAEIMYTFNPATLATDTTPSTPVKFIQTSLLSK